MDFNTDLESEIMDSSEEIWDIPELRDEEYPDDVTFNAFLESNWDF